MNKTQKKLIISTAISFFLFVISFFFVEKSSPKGIKSALLNPKYKDSVTKITLSTIEEKLSFEKKNDFWFMNEIPVETKFVESLIEKTSEIRMLYVISDNKNDFEKLQLSPTNSLLVEFADFSQTYSKIYFGINDALTNKIAIRPENSEKSYETENNFSQFLTTDINYWAIGEIFYEIKNPDTITFVYPEEKISFSINSSEKDFGEISKKLLSIRHGKVAQEISGNFVATIKINDGNGKIFAANILKNDSEYFIQKENVFYEISEWTFKKILEIFEKK